MLEALERTLARALLLIRDMPSNFATRRVANPIPPRQIPDLRERIVDASLALVCECGEPALTIRAIASRCGVAPSELYRHFPGKRALVGELSRHGHERLCRWLDDPAWQATIFQGGLEALCHRYLDFARRRPRLYRLMFSAGARGEAFTSRARVLLSESPDDPSTRPLQLWMAMHGLALTITRHVEAVEAAEAGPIDARFIDDYIATIVRGIEVSGPLLHESAVDPSQPSLFNNC